MTARRPRALSALALAAVVLAPVSTAALAQKQAPAPAVAVEELMKPVDLLPDLGIGPADAKVTVIEYSSLTCPHCATFATKVFPDFKTKYVDTGKVRFISREFPLDNLAAAAAMLTRCIAPEKGLALQETMFATQNTWARGEGSPVPRLFEIAKQAGFTQEAFNKCLEDQKLLDAITAARARASEKFEINSTPTFFVNGKRTSVGSLADLDKAIEPLLAAK